MTFIPPQARKQYAPARSTRITKISPMKPLVQLELWEAQEIAKTAPEAKECEPVAFSQLIRQLNPVEPSFKPSQKPPVRPGFVSCRRITGFHIRSDMRRMAVFGNIASLHHDPFPHRLPYRSLPLYRFLDSLISSPYLPY